MRQPGWPSIHRSQTHSAFETDEVARGVLGGVASPVRKAKGTENCILSFLAEEAVRTVWRQLEERKLSGQYHQPTHQKVMP